MMVPGEKFDSRYMIKVIHKEEETTSAFCEVAVKSNGRLDLVLLFIAGGCNPSSQEET